MYIKCRKSQFSAQLPAMLYFSPYSICMGLIDSLREMRGELAPEETELRELTDSALGKLQAMSDAEFAELELYPDFDQ